MFNELIIMKRLAEQTLSLLDRDNIIEEDKAYALSNLQMVIGYLGDMVKRPPTVYILVTSFDVDFEPIASMEYFDSEKSAIAYLEDKVKEGNIEGAYISHDIGSGVICGLVDDSDTLWMYLRELPLNAKYRNITE